MRNPNSIRVGNQTAFSAATPWEPFDYALAHGFDAFEWFPDKKAEGGGWDEVDLSAEQRRRIRQTAHERDLRLSVHARWSTNPLETDASDLLSRDIALAQDLGAQLFIMHLFAQAGVTAYAKSIVSMIERLADAGMQLAIENTPTTTAQHFNDLFARLRALNLPRLDHVGMCLDLGHANLCETTRNDYLQYLDQLGPQVPIIHLHLHENWGDGDTHLTLFTGPSATHPEGIIGLVQRLRKRGFTGSMILEQWPHPPALLDQARARLRGLLGQPDKTSAPSPCESSPAHASDRPRRGKPQ